MKKNYHTTIIFSILIMIGALCFEIYHYQKHGVDYVFYVVVALFIVLFIFTGLSVLSARRLNHIRKLENRLSLWNTISYRVKGAGETAFEHLPIGIIVLDKKYDIMWSNIEAKNILMSPLENKNLKDIANSKLLEFVEENKELIDSSKEEFIKTQITIYNHIYDVEFLKEIYTIYLHDVTNLATIKNQYDLRTQAIGYINVDNLEEIISDFDVQTKSEYQGRITAAIAKWADEFNAFVRAFSTTRFIIIASKEQLLKMIESGFSILDEIKHSFKTTSLVTVTLSIGIVCDDVSANVLSNDAQEQLDLALNRGGDQAVVKINGDVMFFGAKSDPVLKEEKTQIRYRYQELEYLIQNSDCVFVIGHRFADADSFGSCVAIYNLCKSIDKDCYIIQSNASIDDTVKRVYADVKISMTTLYNDIIEPKEALKKATNNSLLVVVDCQATSQIILKKNELNTFKNIAIIDHHRKNEKGTIEGAKFYFSEPAASSCVELIFALLDFCPHKLPISSVEATWMLLGIIVDTNSFVYNSSASTLQVATTLFKYSGNISKARKYLTEDINEKRTRNEFMSNIKMINDCVAIASIDRFDRSINSPTLAKVSNELLTIDGVKLAVTVGFVDSNAIKMSARSLGEFNCQTLMERLGGGGHLTQAATEIHDRPIEEVLTELENIIKDIMKPKDEKENKSMKVILTEDIKGKGKRGEVKDFATGFANNLIRENRAVQATLENLQILEQDKQKELQNAEKLHREMEALKAQIESQQFKIIVKRARDGKIMGKITTKHIAEIIESTIGVKLDKRKITFNHNVVALGDYDAQIQLLKDVTANINLLIAEK